MTVALRQRPLTQVVNSIVKAGNGCWLDPSDMSTMFQDAAGTTPVTAVEQPVGLILDKSQGLMLGPEIFSDSTATFTGNSSRVSDSVYRVYSPDSSFSSVRFAGVTAGKFYRVEVKIDSIQTLGTGLRVFASGPIFTSTGKKTLIFAADDGVNLDFKRAGGVTDIQISSISVREIYGNHATQSVTASRPTLSARKNVLLATETLATQSVTTIATQYTLSFTGTGSVTLSGSATGTLTGTGADNRVSLTVTPTAGTLTLTVSGSVTKAQLELGAVAGPYQRVNTSTDYDTNPVLFPKYLKFDGVDDYLNLPYMGLYAGGACSIVVSADNKPSTTDTLYVTERDPLASGSVYFPSRIAGGVVDSFIRNSSSVVVLDSNGVAVAYKSGIIVSIVDNGTNITKNINSSAAETSPYIRSGGLTASNTTIGASLTTSKIYSNFNLFGLIITKSALTDAQRIKCERFLARKSGVVL